MAKSIPFALSDGTAVLRVKSTVFSGVPCANSEVGIIIHGQVRSGSYTTTSASVTLCLGNDAGLGETGNFQADFGNVNNVTSVQIDPAYSTATL